MVLVFAIVTTGSAQAASGPLQVRRISPSGEQIQLNQELVIQFDRNMIALGDMTRTPSSVHVKVSPDVGCQWRWLDATELACRMVANRRFRPATQYTVTVGTALKAQDGTHLAAPMTATFTTFLPELEDADYPKWLGPEQPSYELRFNLPVTAREVASNVVFENEGGEVASKVEPVVDYLNSKILKAIAGVPGALTESENPNRYAPFDADKASGEARHTWRITPVHTLKVHSEYSLTLKPGLTSSLGPLPAAGREVSRNATYADFAFSGIDCSTNSPSNRAFVALGTTPTERCIPGSASARFSVEVPEKTMAAIVWQRLSTDDLFDSKESGSDQTPLSRDGRANIAPVPMSLYRASVPAGVKDLFGRVLTRASSVEFLTGHRTPFLEVPPSLEMLEADESTFVPFRFTNLDAFNFSFRHLNAGDLQPGKLPRRESAAENVDILHQATARMLVERSMHPVLGVSHFFEGSAALLDHAESQRPSAGQTLEIDDTVQAPADVLKHVGADLIRDRIVHETLGLRDRLKQRSGIAWGQFTLKSSLSYGIGPLPAFLEVTPYQVFTKLGLFNGLVWVTSLKTGHAVSNAKIQLLTSEDGDLDQLHPALGATARTDADGMAVLTGTGAFGSDWFTPYRPKYSGEKLVGYHNISFYLSVTHGQEMALLPLDANFKHSAYERSQDTVKSNVQPPHGHMRVWLVTNQGIYRPGSDVNFSVFVRDQDNHTLIAAPKLDYTLQVTDPTGNVVMKREHVKLSAFGDVQAQLVGSANAPSGWYDVSVSWPDLNGVTTRSAGGFRVTEFVPSPFDVQVTFDGKVFGPGEKLKAIARARLHAGGPYTDAKVHFNTQIMPQAFSPRTQLTSGFHFEGAGSSWYSPVIMGQTDARSNAAGDAKLQLALAGKSEMIYGQVQVQAIVESVRGTHVAAQASAVYAARDRFIGLRSDSALQTSHKAFKVQYLVVDPEGEPHAMVPLVLQLQRWAVVSRQVKNAAGESHAEQQESWSTDDQCKAVSDFASASCSLTPSQPGRYRVLATVTDTRGRVQESAIQIWVAGPGDVQWTPQQGVTLVPDKPFYNVGDVAHVMVQNPYQGARALITVERFGVLWKQMVTLQGSAPVIDVPISKHFFPGAFLSVAIFSPRVSAPAEPDVGKPTTTVVKMTLAIHGKGDALDVSVAPDAAERKPGETVHVAVNVRNRDGKAPGATRLVVAVVDQSVLDLLQNGAATYDPLATFYAPPSGLDVTNYGLAHQLLTGLQPGERAGIPPPPPSVSMPSPAPGIGDPGAEPNVRSEFKAATYWNPTLVTDASGKASFQFKVPDNLTRWRILVVAMSPGAAMGLGDASVRVNLPIQIESALPNQVHVGDRFDAEFNVTNRTDVSRDISTHLMARGPIANEPVEHDRSLRLGKFEHGLSGLSIEATGTGSIRFTASARSELLGDAMTTTIPVREAGATEVAAEYGSLNAGDATVAIKLPPNALASTTKLAVHLSPTLIGGLDGAFAYMRDTPLQSWEMRLSRGVLASDYLRLKPVIGDTFDWPHANDDVDSMFKHASEFQNSNGGMAFWIPQDGYVSEYLSLYTALAFNWLERDGHTPPADVRNRLNEYLHMQILTKQADDHSPLGLVLRAAALAALAPSASVSKDAVADMLPELPKLTLFGQALLLNAALDTHDHDSAQTIAKSLFSYAEESGGEISFNQRTSHWYVSLLATPLRSNCAILDALVEYKHEIGDQNLLGDTPAKLMRWINHRRRNQGGWPNSQENVFCTSAIAHYADVYEMPVHKLTASVRVAGKSAGDVQFASRSDAGKNIKHALNAAERSQPFNVVVGRAGDGRLYYNVLLTYAMPPDALGATDAGMTIDRAYFVQRGDKWMPVKVATHLHRGDFVRVALTVDAPTERHYVVVSDPLPGAFEAVNEQLATTTTNLPAAEPGVSVLMFNQGAWPNMSIVSDGFYHREIALNAVHFYADTLPAGRYRLVYSAQVTNPGHFIAPAASVHEIYQPDVFGRGEAQHIVVTPAGR